jgi:hypothetical protein
MWFPFWKAPTPLRLSVVNIDRRIQGNYLQKPRTNLAPHAKICLDFHVIQAHQSMSDLASLFLISHQSRSASWTSTQFRPSRGSYLETKFSCHPQFTGSKIVHDKPVISVMTPTR